MPFKAIGLDGQLDEPFWTTDQPVFNETRTRRNWGSLIALSLAIGVRARAAETPSGAAQVTSSQTISLDGPDWKIATDPENNGREQKWFEAPHADAKPALAPCTIQEIFPSYAGLAWYWKEFEAPTNPHHGGRFLLRFWKVDYKADVWVNGRAVGSHEDGDEPFILDATEAVRAGRNVLAVRVLHESGLLGPVTVSMSVQKQVGVTMPSCAQMQLNLKETRI